MTAQASELHIDDVRGPFRLRWRPSPPLSNAQLEAFCALYHNLHIERESDGTLIVMSPAGWLSGARELEIGMQLRLWAKRDGSGVATGPSAGFYLPNGAMRDPDAAWTTRSRLANFSHDELDHFLPIPPDFAVELRSKSDHLRAQQAKLEEYVANGVRLGWLLDPTTRTAYVYRPGTAVEVIENAAHLDAWPELPGFVLELEPIWE